ncbi:dUTP diphosphatase [Francisella orientalis]|uniref:Deoxyuridine 5'-triphosphate nucleotidohydrolase n=4 Tax=Francisella orientalis TaxID=299583 RepID=A0AAP6X7I6_9GAMM|nr:dUTP diphosphatase [Francisella orientalis]AFJ42770.1 deoxyuridine 5'-triphosphate nucleotidohydrolase [Francisella orientalis str. Toba 04]AKN85003.1 Deoxyuridine 5'-triphosphate nucleotidohydrolase [Francisella orientalis FNO12]AKN86541.1 Deoxyuridine 5'-triphosphate nucleotidohydrolase [Francisella orientalis FNO24]AKN88079.1 Deoxyuridine 5'-triphosphate nucleotidohydrolase [Francisella orientalis]AKU04834.1 Deoxyuridine 5'-triphosphate nucleotidohydrolase [Francisella orientalis]
MNIELKILNREIVKEIPMYGTEGSAAVDLRACISQVEFLNPGECKLIGTGVAINIANPNYAAMILPRSGLGHKKGLVLGNGTGLIDSDYQGELIVSCFNRSQEVVEIEPLMRFAQLVIVPVVQARFDVVEEFSQQTIRAAGGFGHTGV